ncbi:MAG: response regulator [Candidatus Sericytochromatia bacterium]
MNEPINVLVVDDIAPNIRLVAGLLGPEGYDVSFANSGKKALEQVLANDFDLILLDIMMPDMDGIAVCKAIKEHPEKRDIPIIFLTGKTDEVSIMTAFETGGVDYLQKPVNPVELVARVKTHLELKKARDTISQTNTELKQALDLKNQFLGLAAHDLRNPLSAVQGYLRLLEMDEATTLGPEAKQFMDSIQHMTQNMLEMINTFLEKAALELGHVELHFLPMDLMASLKPLIQLYREQALQKNQRFHLHVATPEIWLEADPYRLNQILDNLLSNAIKYTPADGQIDVFFELKGEELEIRVKDSGPGFVEEDKSRIFGYFQRLTARPTAQESSNGVGLALTKQMVELHQGHIHVESSFGEGATFIVTLPLHPQPQTLNLT